MPIPPEISNQSRAFLPPDIHIFSAPRVTVAQVAKRLGIGRLAVYAMLEAGTLPGIRIGRRWLITREAYEQWERTCGENDRLASPRSQS